jgi:predicted HAD superfamily phosphohydrolase YqeG
LKGCDKNLSLLRKEMGYNSKGERRRLTMATRKKTRVKTFATEMKIFQVMKALEALDEKVNRFILQNKVKKVVSVSDTTTTDDTGATIGLIRVLTYEG